MKIMKKILFAAIVLVMMLVAAPLSNLVDIDLPDFDLSMRASALASTGKCGDNVTYTYNSSTGELVISGEGPMTDYYYNYDYSPFYNSNIKSVVIEDGVTTIGDNAFLDCKSLTIVTIPDSVTTIGDEAFYDCNNLTSITIGDSVTTIGYRAFYFCDSLTSVTIGDSVTTIGKEAFSWCTSLTSVIVDADNTAYSSDNLGVLFNKDKSVLIQYPVGNENTSYAIPDSVTTIGKCAFLWCTSLTSVTFSDSVTTIGNYAFYYCSNLTSVTIGDSVTTIGDEAFCSCTSLTSVTIPDSVTNIGDFAFNSCKNLETAKLGKNIKVIGDYAFARCYKLEEIILPVGLISIGYSAFYSCDELRNVVIPSTVTTICESPFVGCDDLASIEVDETNLKYSSDDNGVLFDKDKSVLIQYPEGNRNISYAIPDSVTTIGDEAFCFCTSLTSITIPDSVTTIGDYAFSSCNGLTDVYYGGTEEQWKAIEISSENDDLLNANIHYSLHSHSYTSEITTPATHLKEGVETFTCACGDTYTKPVAKIPHSYNKVVTAPTCTSKGYTTYTCDCGYSYVDDYVDTKAHSYTSVVTTPATHLSEGVRTNTCTACSDSYTEAIAKTKEHSYVATGVIAPTCEAEGYTTYNCECGHSYKGDKKAATGHNYDGDYCRVCGESKIENCTCNCHKGGFMGFIWKIVQFFWKLFKMNPTCECGVRHY